ncbi:class I SAM-dependent methyltransferase [Aestuariivivens insulae]|uniref:class I SAM-dependent methyltransferase n=1 Tax=Aestuariivivens insulae TaxID=1621988 RepID=UPI001F571075|nr:class I SAM-dependent methyltransferase [Aestuariivivens insulae]
MAFSKNELSDMYGFESPFKPDPIAKRALNYIKNNNKLLDIGCGEGADSVFFAKNGFQVDALDNNAIYLSRLKAYKNDHQISNIFIQNCDVITYNYPKHYYDVVNCILVGCCMRKSEFESLLTSIKQTIKHNGFIIMSLRNYLDPEFIEYSLTEKMIEPNTFLKKDACCKTRYYIEKNRLRDLFKDFEILYYFEGLSPDKYEETEHHGDSYIICKKV